MTDQNQNCQKQMDLPIPMFNKALLISKCPFQDGTMPGGSFILQLNVKNLSGSKINILHYLALQFESLGTLLWESHCTNMEKLVLPSFQLAGSSLSRKHGLTMFIQEQLRYMLLDYNLHQHQRESNCVKTLMVMK